MSLQPDLERHLPRIDLGDAVEQMQVQFDQLPVGSVLEVKSSVLTYTIEIYPEAVKIWNILGDYGGFRGNFYDLGYGLTHCKMGVLKTGEQTLFPYFEYDHNNNTLPDDSGWIDTVMKIKIRKPERE